MIMTLAIVIPVITSQRKVKMNRMILMVMIMKMQTARMKAKVIKATIEKMKVYKIL